MREQRNVSVVQTQVNWCCNKTSVDNTPFKKVVHLYDVYSLFWCDERVLGEWEFLTNRRWLVLRVIIFKVVKAIAHLEPLKAIHLFLYF